MNRLAHHNKTALSRSLAIALAMMAGSAAADESAMREELNMLRERVVELEANRPAQGSIATNGNWSDRVTLGGYLAVDAFHEEYEDDNHSDIILSGAEFWIEAEIAENVTAMLLFYYEDGYDAPDLDEATISYSPNEMLTFTAGRTYLPFGTFESNMVSDPLTLEIGEIREDMLMVGMENQGFYGAAYLFNGDIEEEGRDDLIENYGFNLGYLWEEDISSVDVGLGWISSMHDTDGIEAVYSDYGLDSVTKRVDGLAAHAIGRYGPVRVIAEYVGALEDLAGKGSNTQMKAWNIEAGYDLMLAGMDSTLGIGYQETTEAAAFDLPEKRVIGAISMAVMENTTLAFEYKKDKDYAGDDTHTGTAQVAVEF